MTHAPDALHSWTGGWLARALEQEQRAMRCDGLRCGEMTDALRFFCSAIHCTGSVRFAGVTAARRAHEFLAQLAMFVSMPM